MVANLLPTPDHSHYLFSLKEFSRVICGCLLSVPETMEDLNAMKRLWVHEVFRVYHDRLVGDADRTGFFQTIRSICTDDLLIDFDELCKNCSTGGAAPTVGEKDVARLLFCDFGDSKSEDKFYKEVADMDKFRAVAEDLLVKHNEVSRKPMDLVLFDFALEHLCRISRVLKQVLD